MTRKVSTFKVKEHVGWGGGFSGWGILGGQGFPLHSASAHMLACGPTPFSVGSFMGEMLMGRGCVCVSEWAEKEEENLWTHVINSGTSAGKY